MGPRVLTMDMEGVALIAGATGIIGYGIAKALDQNRDGIWSNKVYGVGQKAWPPWLKPPKSLHYIQCDLLDEQQTMAALGELKNVTHLFWATWSSRDSEDENCSVNGRMFQLAINALISHGKLRHICLTTGTKHYLGGLSSFSFHIPRHYPPYQESMLRVSSAPNFYYTLEDIMFESASKFDFTWSVHRPCSVIGLAGRSRAQLIRGLAVYACICKHQNLVLVVPGNKYVWDSLMDASDADLIAEQMLWAASTSAAQNQAFNITNGDIFSWRMLWSLIGNQFGVALKGPEADAPPFKLGEFLQDKGPVWDEIVVQNNLYVSKLDEICDWSILDTIFNVNFQLVNCMNKSREFGFVAFENTEKCVLRCINQMKEARIIPS